MISACCKIRLCTSFFGSCIKMQSLFIKSVMFGKVKPFFRFGKDSFLRGVLTWTVLFTVISDDRSIVLWLFVGFIEVEIDSFPVSLFFLSNGLIEHYFK
jgi:hypothetical protein